MVLITILQNALQQYPIENFEETSFLLLITGIYKDLLVGGMVGEGGQKKTNSPNGQEIKI